MKNILADTQTAYCKQYHRDICATWACCNYSEQSPSWQANILPQLFKKFPPFHRNRRFRSVFKTVCSLSTFRTIWIQSTLSQSVSLSFILIIFYRVLIGFPGSPLLSSSPSQPIISSMIWALSIIFDEEYLSHEALHYVVFSSLLLLLLLLGPNILQHLILKQPQHVFSESERPIFRFTK